MRIVVFTLSFPPQLGGVQTYLYEIMRRLGEAHQVTIVTPVKGELPHLQPLHKVTVPKGNAFESGRALRTIRPDRVVVGHAHPQLLLPAALYTRNRHVTVTHGNDYLAAQKRWHRPLFNWLLGHSRLLITHAQAIKEDLKELGFSHVRVIYPGTDPIRFRPPVVAPAYPPVLLTVGRLVSRKGIDSVLHALLLLLPVVPELKYTVVGDGPDRSRLQALVQELNLQETVTFLGQVSSSQLLAAYHQAHIFVMPVREEAQAASVEGFGIVYLEASACSLPVIAGRSGGASEAVRHGETGYLVDPDDPEALSEIVLTLLQNPELRRQMGQNGRRWVETEMNWDRAAREFLQIL